MTAPPLISVVMAVYNGGDTLPATLDSILNQQGVEFEFIVVNDGSTDNTAQVLKEYAGRDTRLRIFEQDNQGLTRSLIRGCAEARGEFIARQDAGDISLPGRLLRQAQFLIKNSNVAFVSCGTEFVSPVGEFLFEKIQSKEDVIGGLLTLDIDKIQGPPCHPCVMLRKKQYQESGGYRECFNVAQDLDLWTRLVEHGEYQSIPDVLFRVTLSENGISTTHRAQQIAMAHLILACTRKRRSGESEDEILDKVDTSSCVEMKKSQRLKESAFYYFLGNCLKNNDPVVARKYFISAFFANPLHVKAGIRFLQLSFFS